MPEYNISWIDTVTHSANGGYLVNGHVNVPNNPNNRQYKEVQEWDTVPGNIISTYDPHRGVTVEEAHERKYTEIDVYAENLILGAHANPIEGVFVNGRRYMAKVTARRSYRADVASGGVPPGPPTTPPGKPAVDYDIYLSEYSNLVSSDQNAILDTVATLTNVNTIMNFNVAAQVWPVWVPPEE